MKKSVEKRLGHSNLTMITAKYSGDDRRKKTQELGYRIDLYIPEYKLAIEVDELGHRMRDLISKIERQKKNRRRIGL